MTDRTSKGTNWFWALSFWIFTIVKATGTSLAGWSWWWVFLPFVPVIGEIVIQYGL